MRPDLAADPLARVLATDKGMPSWATGLTPAEFAQRGANLADGGFLHPVLTADEVALRANVEAMADWARANDALLCPHGKTTMSPELFRRQLDAGAWGMTAATVSQVRAFRAFGVTRILLANELVDPAGLDWVLGELDRDPDFDFFAYVDSPAGVAAAQAALGRRGTGRPLQLLVELGIAGGRTGCRMVSDAVELADAVRQVPGARLAGVAGYEGVLGSRPDPATLDSVRRYLVDVRATLAAVAARAPAQWDPIVTAGGSLYFDLVVAELGTAALGIRSRLVLRSGCYVTHDHGMYATGGPSARSGGGPALLPALRLWARVLSAPEPGLALVGFGRRDCSFDAGLPTPLHRLTDDAQLEPLPTAQVVDLNDQHAFVHHDGDLPIGSVLAFGISHPCTTLDKWRLIPVLDETLTVVDCLTTWF